MPASPEQLLTPEEEELARKRAVLADWEARLADRELELASLRADLAEFERRYLQTVGRRYATLDGLRAEIAEAKARRNPHSSEARCQAREARTRAGESARAAGNDSPDDPPRGPDARRMPERSDRLNKLFRRAALLLHPDRTLDGAEKERRHRLMAEVNDAFARGDEERIEAILRDWHTSPEGVHGDGPGAELVRVIRTIAQVEKRVKAIEAEIEQLCRGELFELNQAVEEALASGRDLLKEWVEQLDGDIDEAREELERVTNPGAP